FQAEDGIRDRNVTGVQTCALPISPFVRGAFAGAASGAIPTILVSTNPAAPLAALADIAILPDTGPEVLTGSTRLKAAKAPEMVRSEEHTSGLQSRFELVRRLLLD